MEQFLKTLRDRRASIQAGVEEEQGRPIPDRLRLTALKKLRLRFKDQIEFIERMDRHGRPRPVPVVRRRAFQLAPFPFRDFILGGATKGVLTQLKLPILLSH